MIFSGLRYQEHLPAAYKIKFSFWILVGMLVFPLTIEAVERTGISIEYKPVKKFTVTLGGSYIFKQQYEIQNENGNKIQSFVNIDPSLSVALNLKYNF